MKSILTVIVCMAALMLSAQQDEYTQVVWQSPQGLPAGAGSGPTITEASLRSFIDSVVQVQHHSLARKEDPNIVFFALRKNPNRDRYQIRYNPRQAYLAINGEGDERMLPLYLLLQAVLRSAQDPPMLGFNYWVGRYMAWFNIRYDKLEAMLSSSISLRSDKDAVLAGYREQKPGPEADFTISPTACTTPCVVTLASSSRNTDNESTYQWSYGVVQLLCSNSECSTNPLSSGEYNFTLVVTNSDGQRDTVSKPFRVQPEQSTTQQPTTQQPTTQQPTTQQPTTQQPTTQQSIPEQQRRRSQKTKPYVQLSAAGSIPVGIYRQQLEYLPGINNWRNSAAGMALPGAAFSVAVGLQRKKYNTTTRNSTTTRIGLEVGALWNPYRRQALRDQLQHYEKDLNEMLAELTVGSPGHRFVYPGLQLEWERKGWLAINVAGGYLFKINQEDIFLSYFKEDNSSHASLLTYGHRWNRAPFGSASLRFRLTKPNAGSYLDRYPHRKTPLLFLDISYQQASFNFPRRTYSFGSELALLRLEQLPVRLVKLGLILHLPSSS